MLTEEQIKDFEGRLAVATKAYGDDLKSDQSPELNGGKVAGYSAVFKLISEGKTAEDFRKMYAETATLHRQNPSNLYVGMLTSFREVFGVLG